MQRRKLAAVCLAFGIVPASAREQQVTCVRSWSEVRQANRGYDHVVHLYNGCEVRVRCEVTSDVNPRGVRLVVPVYQHREVVLTRNSSFGEFAASVECRSLRRG